MKALVLAERLRKGGVAYNPLSKDFMQNPYPTYEVLRKNSPIHRSFLTDTWIVTRFADVEAILRDHERFSNDPRLRRHKGSSRALPPGPDDYSILLVDPPQHTRLRRIVNRGFTRNAIEARKPVICEAVTRLLDEIPSLQKFDFIKAIAHPLPLIVITEMLGIPACDRKKFGLWSKQRARLLELTVSASERELGLAAGNAMAEYFTALAEKRRVAPKDDITSLLVQENEGEENFSHEEAIDMLAVLLVAGNETTANLIGNGMLALLNNPSQVERLRQDPDAINGAVNEMLRYDGPVQSDFRVARTDCDISGTTIRKGDGVILLIGAANRDPEAFERADEFDIARGGPSHLAFGRGIHHCIGAVLAKLQAKIVIEMVLKRFKVLELIDRHPRFQNTTVLRGLKSLEMRAIKSTE